MITETGKLESVTYITEGGGSWCTAVFKRTDRTRFRVTMIPSVDFMHAPEYTFVGEIDVDPYSVFGNEFRNPTYSHT